MKQNVLTWFKDSISRLFESEARKRFDSATELARFSWAAAIPGMEEALRLEPDNEGFRSILAVFYAASGEERIGGIVSRSPAELNPMAVVNAVKRMIEEDESIEAENSLDEVFKGALGMFDKSIRICPDYPGAYSSRARTYRDMADDILTAYHVYPRRIVESWDQYPVEGIKPKSLKRIVSHGTVDLGFTDYELSEPLPFVTELMWLYGHAEQDYRKALQLDPTDADCYLALSDLLSQLGNREEADENLDKALSILNKAIEADCGDAESFQRRADAFEKLGQTELAIGDLQQALDLKTMRDELEFVTDRIKTRIEALRKRREA